MLGYVAAGFAAGLAVARLVAMLAVWLDRRRALAKLRANWRRGA